MKTTYSNACRLKSDCWKRIEIIPLNVDTKELKSAENEFNLFNVRLTAIPKIPHYPFLVRSACLNHPLSSKIKLNTAGMHPSGGMNH